MAERLDALGAAWDTAPSARKEGNIPRAHSLPPGFSEMEDPLLPPSEPGRAGRGLRE